jgi:predicted TIM-barrel fold metal-dependent hydrolase
MLSPALPHIDDPEGESVPFGLPEVFDAHVHVFPEDVFSSIRRWFDTHAWRIRYRMKTRDIFSFLLSRGVRRIFALQYAHKPGIASALNAYLASECTGFEGRVTGLATVFPGEKDAGGILKEAFMMKLAGVKLHAHVQCFDLDAHYMEPIYATCSEWDKPLVVHAGREPKSPAYHCDPHKLCSIERVERVIKAFPKLRLCVPHLGFDETDQYRRLIESYDNIWLDTTMMMADYFPNQGTLNLKDYRPDRVMYGSDFPNIPYSWDRELRKISGLGLTDERLEWLLNRSARDFFKIH